MDEIETIRRYLAFLGDFMLFGYAVLALFRGLVFLIRGEMMRSFWKVLSAVALSAAALLLLKALLYKGVGLDNPAILICPLVPFIVFSVPRLYVRTKKLLPTIAPCFDVFERACISLLKTLGAFSVFLLVVAALLKGWFLPVIVGAVVAGYSWRRSSRQPLESSWKTGQSPSQDADQFDWDEFWNLNPACDFIGSNVYHRSDGDD